MTELTRESASAWLQNVLEQGLALHGLSGLELNRRVGVADLTQRIRVGKLPSSEGVASLCSELSIAMPCSREEWDAVRESFRRMRWERAKAARVQEGVTASEPQPLSELGLPNGLLRFGANNVVIVPNEIDDHWLLPDKRVALAVLDVVRSQLLLQGLRRGLSPRGVREALGVSRRFLNGECPFHETRLSCVIEFLGLTPIEASYLHLCVRVAHIRTPQPLQWRRCVECEVRMLVPQGLAEQREYCSGDCHRRRQTFRTRYNTPLRRYLREEMHKRGKTSQTGWAEAWDISYGCVSGYFTKPERVLTRKVLQKISSYLGEPVEGLIELQDGQVGEQRWGNHPPKDRSILREFEKDPEWLNKRNKAIGRANKGRTRTPEQRAKLMEILTPEEQARRQALMTVTKRLPDNRLRAAVKTYQQHLGRQPTAEELREFAAKKIAELGLPDSTLAVVNSFRDALGMAKPPRSGKKLKGSKADQIREMAAQGRTRSQIIQEGVRRAERGEGGWAYGYVDTVLHRAQAQQSSA